MTKTVDLTELKRLLAEATPGPWVLDKGGGHAYDRIIGGDVVQIHGTIAGRGSWSERVCENFGNLDLPGPAANVEIICALHNAAHAMIEELERLRDLHGICGHHCEACARRDDEIGELREQNEALREAIRPIASCHLPPSGYEQVGVTAHFTADQIRTAKASIAEEKK